MHEYHWGKINTLLAFYMRTACVVCIFDSFTTALAVSKLTEDNF